MKYFEYEIPTHEINTLFFPIREKTDSISALMAAVKLMLIQKPQDNIDAPHKIALCVSKMSRVFFLSSDKIYTLTFPFFVEQQEDHYLKFSSEFIHNLDSRVATSILDIAKSLQQTKFIDLGVIMEESSSEFEDLWPLFKFLMLHEDGYVRFDHDPIRANGQLHPINHLDIFYRNSSTFKLGLYEKASLEMLTDILDVNTNCHFIREAQ